MKITDILRERYPRRLELARHFSEAVGDNATIEALTRVQVHKLGDYLTANMSRNSARTYLAMFKSAIRLYDQQGIVKDATLSAAVRSEDTISVYLTNDEIGMIEDYALIADGERLWYALHFLISAYTGCRASDVCQLKEENIINGCVTYVSKKTGVRAQIPMKIGLDKWVHQVHTMRASGGYTFSINSYNILIKKICRDAGINSEVKVHTGGKDKIGRKWMYVSSHTARRSFASNLYIKGCDITSIAIMMGHRKPEMTYRYLCCGLRSMDDSIMSFFK